MSKHNKTLVFILDPEDEPDDDLYIHWVELDFEEWKPSKACDEKKIKDWTGL